ncbi:hypothetical protein [Moorena sp. SIO3H5]|uniref:hypothetical protein n=1 Tax=Moorena sp. SIO3H5 TaxID=2607834 RepID=UPI0013B64E03|nr:hypothetical protein [Moorena sp. SIO3H5]NEO70923.1 hypothetical protein [Moorena sp. SIO3H5]
MYSSKQSSQPVKYKDLNYQGVYPCPVCRVGQIQNLSLMEAFACHECRHIFTADLERQRLKITDRQPPMTWHWNGKKWTGAHLEGVEWGWVNWFLALAFVVCPTTLIGAAVYLFPPAPDSPISWLPAAWVGLTFFCHLAIVVWLVMEFYQFPVWEYLRIRRQRIMGR